MKKFDLAQIQIDYKKSKKWREAKKYAFAIGTLGFGALYLWATTKIVKQGEIGLRRNNRGEMILLPPGRHSNFPWESYPVEPQSLSKPCINLGPYTILCVKTGFVAKTYNEGKLEILEEGQHLLENATHVFKSEKEDFIPIMQETKKLQEISAYTSDNVGLTLHADVRYQITDPKKAISQIDDIDKSIKEIAEISISQIVSHHNLDDFAPVTSVGADQQHNGMSKVIAELTSQITNQFSQLGIKIITIGITSWCINDKQLAHELAQGAVIKSQAESRRIAAKRDAEVKKISTNAQAEANLTTASSEAKAIELKGLAVKKVAEDMKGNPEAFKIYMQGLQNDLVKGTTNPNLFFYQPLTGAPQLPQTTLPLVPAAPSA